MYIYIYSEYHVCEQGLYMQPYSSLYLLLSLSNYSFFWIFEMELMDLLYIYGMINHLYNGDIDIYSSCDTASINLLQGKVVTTLFCSVCTYCLFAYFSLFFSFFFLFIYSSYAWFFTEIALIFWIYDSISRKNTALHIQNLKFGFPFSFYFFFLFFLTGSFIFNVFLLLTREYGCMNAKFLKIFLSNKSLIMLSLLIW